MAVMDEFKESRERMKNATPKEKLAYFWCYYKFHTIFTLILLIILGTFVYESLTKKDTVFNAAFVNTAQIDSSNSEFIDNFANLLNIDTTKEQVHIDSSLYVDLENPSDQTTYYSLQKLITLLATSSVDITLMSEDLQRSYAYSDMFHDLTQVLTAEQIRLFTPYFYYIDAADCEAIEETQLAGIDYLDYKDPYAPELMTTPIPVGIRLVDAQSLSNAYYYESTAILSIPISAPNIAYSIAFIDYIFSTTSSSSS